MLPGEVQSRLFEENNPPSQEEVFFPSGNHEEIQGNSNERSSEYDEQPEIQKLGESDEGGTDLHSKAASYFKVRGENELVTRGPDLKGQNKKEQQKRFILLYVWAYSEIFKVPVPNKEKLFEDAKRCSIHDGNFSKAFREVDSEHLIDTGSGLELNVGGDKRVDEILEDLEDSSSKEGFPYWKDNKQSGAKRASLNKEDEQQIKEWVEMPLNTGEFDVRTLNTSAQHAMFALWAITKRLHVANAVKPKMAYLYLTKRYATVPINQRPFTNALNDKNNSNKFRRNADGLYYLTREAENKVESWIEE